MRHDVAVAAAKNGQYAVMGVVYQQLWRASNTFGAADCGGSPIPGEEVAPEALGTPPACPSALGPFTFSIDLKVAALKASCDAITVEASSPGWIGAFGQATFWPGAGSLTVFAGMKAGGSLGPLAAEAKTGFYVSVNGTGNLTDYGVRFDPSLSVQAAGVEYNAAGQAMDVSFAGSFDW